MKYSCEICKYSTDNGGNWYKHRHSKTHIGKVEIARKLNSSVTFCNSKITVK